MEAVAKLAAAVAVVEIMRAEAGQEAEARQSPALAAPEEAKQPPPAAVTMEAKAVREWEA